MTPLIHQVMTSLIHHHFPSLRPPPGPQGMAMSTFLCCHTPITNTESGNDCGKERIVIWRQRAKDCDLESRLIWHQGVPNCSFPCSVTLIKLLHLSWFLLPSEPSCTACLLFSAPALHSLLGWLILPGSLPGFPMSQPKTELGS